VYIVRIAEGNRCLRLSAVPTLPRSLAHFGKKPHVTGEPSIAFET
jgi:hypothetical protein